MLFKICLALTVVVVVVYALPTDTPVGKVGGTTVPTTTKKAALSSVQVLSNFSSDLVGVSPSNSSGSSSNSSGVSSSGSSSAGAVTTSSPVVAGNLSAGGASNATLPTGPLVGPDGFAEIASNDTASPTTAASRGSDSANATLATRRS